MRIIYVLYINITIYKIPIEAYCERVVEIANKNLT